MANKYRKKALAMQKDFSDATMERMNEQGMTIEDLAYEMKIPVGRLHRYMTCRALITLRLIAKINRILNFYTSIVIREKNETSWMMGVKWTTCDASWKEGPIWIIVA